MLLTPGFSSLATSTSQARTASYAPTSSRWNSSPGPLSTGGTANQGILAPEQLTELESSQRSGYQHSSREKSFNPARVTGRKIQTGGCTISISWQLPHRYLRVENPNSAQLGKCNLISQALRLAFPFLYMEISRVGARGLFRRRWTTLAPHVVTTEEVFCHM